MERYLPSHLQGTPIDTALSWAPIYVELAVLAFVALVLVRLAKEWLTRIFFDSGRYGIKLTRRKVRRMVARTKNARLSKHIVRVPYLVWWPLLGRLYAGAHVLVVATSGMGKSSALLMWSLVYHVMHWRRGKLIRHLSIYDPKAEFLALLIPLYNTCGWRYLVYTSLPEHPVSASLNIVQTPKMARTVAQAVWSEISRTEGHFHGKARQIFLTLARVTDYRGLWAIYEIARDPDRMKQACKQHPGLARAYLSIQENERSSILSTITGPLSLLEDPLVARMFAPDADTEQPDYASWEVPYAVHICVDWAEGESLAPLTSALQECIYQMAEEAGKRARGRRRGPGTRQYIDEATSGGIRAKKVMSWLSAGRGSRVHSLVVSQDLEQGYAVMGRNQYRSAANNAHIKMVGQTDDEETQRYASNTSGKVTVKWERERPAPSVWTGRSDRESRRIETERRNAMLPDHYAELEWGQFYIRSRTPGRSREVVQSVDIDDHKHQLIPQDRKYQGWTMHGVPEAQIRQLFQRLLDGDHEVWENEWVRLRLKELAKKKLRERETVEIVNRPQGRREDSHLPNYRPPTYEPAPAARAKTCGFCGHENPPQATECGSCRVSI